ncbi:zinc transporter ZupT-like isoform X2 [Dysidea avara]
MSDEVENGSAKDDKQEHSRKSLHKMGLLTCLAIGIHNFPEGIATFVATLSSPSLGAALAIAIAMHNIPEGMCVAMPVYFAATGSKLKALWWSFLSGISEPIGALLGWLIFKELFGSVVYGVLFGLVAGMMVYISLMELLPTAYKYSQDKTCHLIPVSLIIGMAIMASSVLLFLY